MLEKEGKEIRFDDLTGRRFALVTRDVSRLDSTTSAALAANDIVWINLGANGHRDVDGRLTKFLKGMGAIAYLARPDFYAYGSAAEGNEIPGLVASLVAGLGGGLEARGREFAGEHVR